MHLASASWVSSLYKQQQVQFRIDSLIEMTRRTRASRQIKALLTDALLRLQRDGDAIALMGEKSAIPAADRCSHTLMRDKC
jgi:hypothetical protein